MSSLSIRTAVLALCTIPLLPSQDTATVTIGGDTDFSCQTQPGQIPTLTGGVRATATLDYAYDRSTGVLTLAVTNTSPEVAGEQNPVITSLGINLPDGAITGAMLTGQSAPNSSVTPTWTASYASNGHMIGCFGDFDLLLSNGTGSPRGGIANENAANPGGPPNSQVTGPLTFTIQLSGPATENVNAHSIAYGFSSNGSQANVNAALRFQGGGVGGDESGTMGTGGDCVCGTWAKGPARLGTTVDVCMSGTDGCHDCLQISGIPGPTTFGPPLNLTIDIGFPVMAVLDWEFPSDNEVCLSVPIPNDQVLIGFTLYFAVVTHDYPLNSFDQISSCGPFAITVTP